MKLPRKPIEPTKVRADAAGIDLVLLALRHTPVKEIDGENPIKADGKMIVIDGGFSKAYQSTTGIAGYTLLYNSFGMQLVAHQHFNSKDNVLLNGEDELSTRRVVDKELERKKIRDTNSGQELQEKIIILKELMHDRFLD